MEQPRETMFEGPALVFAVCAALPQDFVYIRKNDRELRILWRTPQGARCILEVATAQRTVSLVHAPNSWRFHMSETAELLRTMYENGMIAAAQTDSLRESSRLFPRKNYIMSLQPTSNARCEDSALDNDADYSDMPPLV